MLHQTLNVHNVVVMRKRSTTSYATVQLPLNFGIKFRFIHISRRFFISLMTNGFGMVVWKPRITIIVDYYGGTVFAYGCWLLWNNQNLVVHHPGQQRPSLIQECIKRHGGVYSLRPHGKKEKKKEGNTELLLDGFPLHRVCTILASMALHLEIQDRQVREE